MINESPKKIAQEISKIQKRASIIIARLGALKKEAKALEPEYISAKLDMESIAPPSLEEAKEYEESEDSFRRCVQAARVKLGEIYNLLVQESGSPVCRREIEPTAVKVAVDPMAHKTMNALAGSSTLGVLKLLVDEYPYVPEQFRGAVQHTQLDRFETTATFILVVIDYFCPYAKEHLQGRGADFSPSYFLDDQVYSWIFKLKEMYSNRVKNNAALSRSRATFADIDYTAGEVGDEIRALEAELIGLQERLDVLQDEHQIASEVRDQEDAIKAETERRQLMQKSERSAAQAYKNKLEIRQMYEQATQKRHADSIKREQAIQALRDQVRGTESIGLERRS